MQTPSRNTLSNDFRSSYQRYKALSNTFITWLLSTYEGLSSSSRRSKRTTNSKASQASTKPAAADLEQFAQYIVDCPRHGPEKVPRSILNCLYKIIQRRWEAHNYYCQRVGSDTSSNDRHAHFIRVLEKVFDILGGDAWINGHLTKRKEKAQKAGEDSKPVGGPLPAATNRFFALSPASDSLPSISDDEDEGEVDIDHSYQQSSSSDTKPTKGRRRTFATARQSKKRFKSSFPDVLSGGDESDEIFTHFCLFDDLNMLRNHVRCIWEEWAVHPTLKGLVVAATATDVAVRIAESLEVQLVGHDPSLTGMDPESTREALLSFDGMVRASEDWTIGLMSPYYEAMLETRVNSGVDTTAVATGASHGQYPPVGGSNLEMTVVTHRELVVSSGDGGKPYSYWASFMSRIAGELATSSSHPLLHHSESTLTQLLRGDSRVVTTSDPEQQPRLQEVGEDTNLGEREEMSASERTEGTLKEERQVILREQEPVIPKPCLVFAAQIYLDIDQITMGVDFPYQHVVSQLGKKIYSYINWLSCQGLKRHIKSLTITPSMDLLPVVDKIPAMRDRGPYASMSLAPVGIWQEGMGDFGRLVGVRISRDVGNEITKGVIARVNPNRDSILSPWSWGSRAMHILSESLRFGAKAYNEGGMFITVAHIYNALCETHRSMPPWRHMDSFLAIHGNDIFNGNRPTQQQAQRNLQADFFYNRWRLRMGLPLQEFSKGKRTGQFTKREKNATGRSRYGMHGYQMPNPDAYGPALTLRRPKLTSNRNNDGVSKDVLAVKLVEKKMHLDAEALRLLTVPTSRSREMDLQYVITATKERLDEDMAKMSRNLFAMEAYCQRVIERVIDSIPGDTLNYFLESCGFLTDDNEVNRWEIRENMPIFAAFVLLLVDTYHPLLLVWLQAFEAIAEEDEDADFTLLHEEAISSSAEPGHVEEVVE